MKRIFALLLALVMLLGTFAGCKKQEPVAPAPTEPVQDVVEEPAVDENLEKAIEYLRVFYLNTPEKTPMDYTRLGIVRIATTAYDVVWSVEFEDANADPNLIKIVPNEDGTVALDLNEEIIYDSLVSYKYVLTATITGTDGRVLSISWNHIVPPGLDEEAMAIVDAAYALKEGAALEGTYTLTGIIVSIDEMYSEKYGNITVSMAVRGREDYPIKCYRLKGQGADMLAIGDTITVTGKLKNYKGIIEFDSGCILENVVSGGGTPPTAPEDPLEILKEAYKLKKGQSLPYEVTLTGKISEIQYTWNEKYPNPTFDIVVKGQTNRPIKCYMVEGPTSWLKKIEVTDTVTLTGVITNYQGTIEFNRPTMTYWKRGPGLTQAVNYGSLEEGVAYKMYMDQKTLGKTYYFNGNFDKYLGTSTNPAKAVDVFMEKVEGKGVRFYYMDGETKTYIEIYLNDEGKPRPKTTTNPSIVFNYSKKAKTYCVMLDSQEYYLGTYSTFSTIAASSTFYITGDNAGNRGKTQFLAKFIKSSEVDPGAGEEEVEPDILTGTAMTTAPAAGDVIVMANGTNGMTSMMLAETVAVANGALTGTTNLAQFTVEIDNNGRYSFVTADGKYLTSGKTGSSLTLETSATNYSKWILEDAGDGTYYLKNYKAVYNAGGTEKPQYVEYYGGAFTTYSFQSAKADIYKISFYTDLTVISTGNEIVEAPAAGTAYYMMLDQKSLGKTLFFNGNTESASVTYRLATTENGAEAVQVYLEETTGGYYLYFMNNGVKTYIRVYHREFDDKGNGKGSLELVTSAPAEIMTFDDKFDTLVYKYDDNNSYYMGTYSTYSTISVSNTYFLTSSTVDDTQFPVRFSLTANGGVPGGDEEEPGTGDEPGTGETITANQLTAAPANGDVVVMANGTNGVTTTAAADNKGNSVLAPETVTVADGVLTGTSALGQFTVAIDNNGYYTFAADGKYLTSGETGSALTLEATATDYSKWILEDAGNGKYYLKNLAAAYTYNGNSKPQYLEFYYNFTTYSFNSSNTGIYEITFYAPEQEAELDIYGPLSENTAYNIYLNQVTANAEVYFNGGISGTEFLETSTNAADAVEVKMEKVEGEGVRFYFMDGNTKTYIEVYTNSASKVRAHLATAPSMVYTYDNEVNTYVADINGTPYYLGAYSNFTTIGPSKTSYITGDAASTVGVTQFIIEFVTPGSTGGEGGDEPGTGDEPVTDGNLTANLLTSAPAAGDVVVMANDTNGVTTTAAADNKGNSVLAPETVTIADGVLTGTSALGQFTVAIDNNGYYTFAADGKYLTSGETGSALTLEATATDYSKWILEDAGNGKYYLKNLAAAYTYNGNAKPQYLEFFYNFTTYSFNSSNTGIYAISFYGNIDAAGGSGEQPGGDEPGTGGDPVVGDLVSGEYVMTASNGTVMGAVDGYWIATGNTESAWTLTVDGANVTIRDANGVYIAPRGGNANGLNTTTEASEAYQWKWEKNADGTYSFYGQGEDTVVIAYNSDPQYAKFRAYKTSTVSGNPETYPSSFVLTTVGGNGGSGEQPGGGDEPGTGDDPVTGDLVSGEYVLTASNGVVMGAVDGYWIATGNAQSAWTLTVDGANVTIRDANGVYIAPRGGNANGLNTTTTAADAYQWKWEKNADGTYSFYGQDADTVVIAYNSDPQYAKFRAYKTSTVNGDPETYPSTFALTLVGGAGGDEPGSGEQPGGNEPAVNYGPLQENTAYLIYMNQVIAGKEVYFNGTISSAEYLQTSETASDAVEVKMEKVDGEGVRFYFMNGNTKTYIEIYTNSNGKARAKLATTPSCVYTYNAEAATYVVNMNDTDYYLGAYSDFVTIGPSKTSYITGNNASAVGQTQFVIEFVKASDVGGNGGNQGGNEGGNEGGEEPGPGTPVVGNLVSGEYVMTVAGDISMGVYENYWITAGNAQSVWTLTVDGSNVKICDANGVYIAPRGGNQNGLNTATTEADAYQWKWEQNNDGTYSFYGQGEDTVVIAYNSDPQYAKFRAYKTSTVGGNPETYPSAFALTTLGGNGGNGDSGEQPGGDSGESGGETGDQTYDIYGSLEENTAYHLYMEKPDAELYFSGAMSGQYLKTTESAAEAAEMKMEKVEGEGVRFYFVNGEAKNYVEIYENNSGRIRANVVTQPTTVFTYDNASKTYVVTIGDVNYFLGRIGTSGTTITAADTQEIMGDYVANIGESRFVAEFVEVSGSAKPNNTLADQLAAADQLADGAYLEETTIIEGVVSTINDVYNAQYGNITFTVTVDNTDGITVKCYRVKGEGMDTLVVGDKVKVEGKLTAHSGKAQFDSTATVTITEKSGNAAPVAPSDPKLIVDAAFALEVDASLPYTATLTGKITDLGEGYSSQFKNITLEMEVEGSNGTKTITCYRLKGTGADSLAVGDVIKVTGSIKNYGGTVEFISGCTFTMVQAATKSQPALILEQPAEAPAEASVEAPAEAPVEAPAEAPVEAPAEAPVEAPAEAPAEELIAE